MTAASCPCCGAAAFAALYEAKDVPVENASLHPSADSARRVARGALALERCAGCGFVRNARFDPARPAYDARYEGSQACSPVFGAFAAALVERLAGRFALAGRRVLEIGCGEGDFLAALCERTGASGLGYDPALAEPRRAAAVALRAEPWRPEEGPEADLVVCRHVLEHVQDVAGFVTGVARALGGRPDAGALLEVPDVARILAEGAFEDVYYEHVSYFGAASLAALARRCGLAVSALERGYDGQYLLLEARPARAGAAPVFHPLEQEQARETRAAQDFAARVAARVAAWRAWLRTRAAAGARVVLWGGGSKAAAFLHAVGDAPVAGVVDIHPRRQGSFLPGVARRIEAPETLRTQPPDHVLVMNRIYRDEIAATLAALGLAPDLLALGPAAPPPG